MHQAALSCLLSPSLPFGVEHACRSHLWRFINSQASRSFSSTGCITLPLKVQFSGAMSSGSYSANNKRDDGYGPGGWQYPSSYNDLQPPPQDGMTTQPSVGRFTEKLNANCMFVRKPATPTMVPPKDSSSQSGSSDIVNLNAATGAERKMNKNYSKGKK